MASFDAAAVRQAIAEFTPRRPEKFQDLIPAKEVIAELTQKRASYRAILDSLGAPLRPPLHFPPPRPQTEANRPR